jgi:hypothetical protein
MFPAWPEGWDVDFQLHAPLQTTVSGILVEGYIESFEVSPVANVDNILWVNYGGDK